MPLGRPISLTDNVASKIIRVLATNNQTVFTVTGGYRINQIGVFRNGVRLSNSSDFTATDGATVTLVNPAALNDEILFEIQDDFRVSDAIVSAASTQVIDGDLTVTGTVYGSTVAIHSGGTSVGVAKTLNFVGTGNTFLRRGDTIDISISGGGGGGGLGTAINYADGTTSPFSYIDAYVNVTSDLNLDATVAGGSTSYVVSVIPNITVNSGVAVTVGVGKTMVIDVLQIGDL
tara:strand:- start:995 stop:1690 length:696 start_codon:yes stop_codon:yes gene_type:complete